MTRIFSTSQYSSTRVNAEVSNTLLLLGLIVMCLLMASGCGTSDSNSGPLPDPNIIVVNTAADTVPAPVNRMTLRSAIEQARPTDTITFSPSLNGATIQLSTVADSHTALKGEIYAGGPPVFQGYSDRDYGKSALYARKDITIDASSLPAGITIKWTGGDADPARVLAVYGNLILKNVTVTGGISKAEAISSGTQPFTLARGGGIAVWGTATLENSTISGNKVIGDDTASRDRGAYGGGIYSNGLVVRNSVVSGNSASGYGAAGGGIYSVGGADNTGGIGNEVILNGCSITGNRVTAQHAYGGGLFTLGGGPNNLAWLRMTNCTVARNVAEDNPSLPEAGQFYYRGGGIYIGGGSLAIVSSTIAENEVTGNPATFSGKPNMGGGGIAATIGDAHVVEYLSLQHSIIAGNKLSGAAQDIFSGSLLGFYSHGYNRIGVLDFSQILVPVPDWTDLSRKHYPKIDDLDGVLAPDVLSMSNIQHHSSVISAGTDAGQPAVLSYGPSGSAVDAIPAGEYNVTIVNAGYTGFGLPTDDFLNHALDKVRADYGEEVGSDFGLGLGDLTGVTWYGPARTWPSNTANASWITFWKNLDAAIAGRLGTAGLGDDFWGSFTTGPLCDRVSIDVVRETRAIRLTGSDQRGKARPAGTLGDIGAVER